MLDENSFLQNIQGYSVELGWTLWKGFGQDTRINAQNFEREWLEYPRGQEYHSFMWWLTSKAWFHWETEHLWSCDQSLFQYVVWISLSLPLKTLNNFIYIPGKRVSQFLWLKFYSINSWHYFFLLSLTQSMRCTWLILKAYICS